MKSNHLSTNISTEVETQINALREELDSAHKEYLKEVIHNGSTLAYSNLPEAESDSGSCEHHFANIRGFYSRLLNSIPLKLGGALQLLLGSFDMSHINEQLVKLVAKRDEVEKEMNHVKSDLERLGNDDVPKEHRIFLKFIWALLVADIVSMVGAFIALRESFLVSFILGVLFGASIFLSIKSFVLLYRDKGVANKWLRYSLPWLLLVVAIVVGLMRGFGNDAENSLMTVMLFIIINIVLFGANAVIIYMFYPSHTQLKQIEQTDTLKGNIERNETLITELDNEIEQLNSNKNAMAQYRVQIRHSQKLLFERVQSMFVEAIGVFIQANLRYRTDKKYPACYKIPVEPLAVNNDDETINHFKIQDNEN